MARCTKTLDKHKRTSTSAAAIRMAAAEKCGHDCERLGTVKCRSRILEKLITQALQKNDKLVIAAIEVLCPTKVRTTTAAACFVV